MFWGSTAFHLKGHVDPRLALLGEGGEQLYHPVGELEIISLHRSEQSLQHREQVGEVVPCEDTAVTEFMILGITHHWPRRSACPSSPPEGGSSPA